jgi:D-alanyl-D-alanine carboxypeptidase
VSYRFPVAEFRTTVLLGVLAALLVVAAPVAAQDPPAFVEPAVYLRLFDDADLRGVETPDDEVYDLFVAITGNATLDERIRLAAETRGYVRRPVATTGLVRVDGRRLQSPAAEAWTAMKAAAAADGISLMLTSAFRDLADQQALFRSRLGGGTTDAAIDRALRTSAPPGYSKHHSGYAVDIGEVGATDAGFVNTRAYRWLSEFDFARARLFGFVPSYPVGGEHMGPDPEAWEFVWVGPGRIGCATGAAPVAGFCDVLLEPRSADVEWLADIGVTVGCAPGRFCPDDPVTRGEAASALWRLHGAPASDVRAPFVDVYDSDHFRAAVDWLWANGVVTGTTGQTFSPDDFLTPGDAFALALRLRAFDDRPPATGLPAPPDGLFDSPAVVTEVGDLGDHIDRAEFASVLRAAASPGDS